MVLPILRVLLSQFLVMDDKEILSIILLGGFGEIEAAGNHRLAVNHHHLGMRNCVGSVYSDRYPVIGEKGG